MNKNSKEGPKMLLVTIQTNLIKEVSVSGLDVWCLCLFISKTMNRYAEEVKFN